MTGTLNRVTIMGNLGADPEIRSLTQNGNRVAVLSVATTDSWKDGSGEKHDKTEWHRVNVFAQPLVDLIEKSLKKGSKVFLEGSLETRKYTDKENIERYSTEIVVRQFTGTLKLLDPKPATAPERPSTKPTAKPKTLSK